MTTLRAARASLEGIRALREHGLSVKTAAGVSRGLRRGLYAKIPFTTSPACPSRIVSLRPLRL